MSSIPSRRRESQDSLYALPESPSHFIWPQLPIWGSVGNWMGLTIVRGRSGTRQRRDVIEQHSEQEWPRGQMATRYSMRHFSNWLIQYHRIRLELICPCMHLSALLRPATRGPESKDRPWRIPGRDRRRPLKVSGQYHHSFLGPIAEFPEAAVRVYEAKGSTNK
jgi:hypothetical protein